LISCSFWASDEANSAQAERVNGSQRKYIEDLTRPGQQATNDTMPDCPACGASPEQSTDPVNMSRGVCYCGHPRFYDYKHLSSDCPCQDTGSSTP
jgi:hypothetical protein